MRNVLNKKCEGIMKWFLKFYFYMYFSHNRSWKTLTITGAWVAVKGWKVCTFWREFKISTESDVFSKGDMKHFIWIVHIKWHFTFYLLHTIWIYDECVPAIIKNLSSDVMINLQASQLSFHLHFYIQNKLELFAFYGY